MAIELREVRLPDGRRADVVRGGAPRGPALVLHHGTPGDAIGWADWDDAARAADLTLLAISRPGYGGSTRQPQRRVADCAADVAEIVREARSPWFVTIGWSGGGPHALACAALVPGCRAAATLAGVGPFDVLELDFLAGMGPENLEEFAAARAGEAELRRWMEVNVPALRGITASELAASFGGLIAEVDRTALAGPFAQTLATALRRGLATGFLGWLDDDLAFTRPWGFDPAAIAVPVTVWQGDLDLMVPAAHGRWLADRIPGAVFRAAPGHGHVSLITDHRADILRELLTI